jgi:SAV_6107-like HEPN
MARSPQVVSQSVRPSAGALLGREAAGRPIPPPRSGAVLLRQARGVLVEANSATTAAERFRLAHLAALRTSAALFAERARPASGPRKLLSAWVLVDMVAPEFSEWAGYFAASAATRAAVEAGAVSLVSERDADDQLRAAAEFLTLVEQSFGLLAVPLAS